MEKPACTYFNAPTLTSVMPDSGPLAGGNPVTLTGRNLATTSQIAFDGAPTEFVVLSDTQISATVPAAPAGPATISVVTASHSTSFTFAGLYTYVAPPGA